jgi:hypothetical protein
VPQLETALYGYSKTARKILPCITYHTLHCVCFFHIFFSLFTHKN